MEKRPWVVAALICTGCVLRLDQGARQIFAKDQTCPIERVTTRSRPEIPPHVLLGMQPPHVDPPPPAPPAIAADPARLKMWQDQHQPDPDPRIAIDTQLASFETTGCGQTTLYACKHPSDADAFGVLVVNEETTSRTHGSMSETSGGVTTYLSDVMCLSARPPVPPAPAPPPQPTPDETATPFGAQ